MSNLIQTTTDLAMYMIRGYIGPGDVLIDATCGNGHDTLQLLSAGPSKLYAFDIQKEAIDSTYQLLKEKGFESSLTDGTVKLICDSHENIESYVAGPVKAVIFNLGYLPGCDKTKTTMKSSTLSAAISALGLLDIDGLLCITMYSGHDEGAEEKAALLSWAAKLDPKRYHTAYISMTNQKNSPPEILLITRKR